jgi:hypothetical protein
VGELMGRLVRIGRLGPLLLAVALLLAAVPTVAAAWVAFEKPTASASFGKGLDFSQVIDASAPIRRVELLLTYAEARGPQVIELPAPAGNGRQTLEHRIDPSASGHILPNTRITARWRLVPQDDAEEAALGPAVSVLYADDRFDWKTVSGDLVQVHWYEGGEAFGQRALEIGERAVAETSALLGVTEDEPIDFFIYGGQQPFYDALGPATRENVGGQANAGIRTLFALITPGEIDDSWVGIVIPHELVHLVFDTAVKNPYHFPPRWLNEGLAVYLSQGYDPSDRNVVERAAADGTLIPVDGLTGQFPTTADRFSLAYAESVSAVHFLIRTYDQDALISLIRSYADGRTDDEAFQAALGVDVDAFAAAWLADLEAKAPTRYGPQPPPAGPIPPGWEPGAPVPGSASATPGQPAGPTASAAAPAAPAGGEAGQGSGGPPIVAPALALATVVGVLVLALVLRRRRVVRP